MKKLMVYPFNKRACKVARYRRLLEGYELTAVISPPSYGCEGKDISFLDGGDFAGISITGGFEEALSKSEAVLFVESTYRAEPDFYMEKIKAAIQKERDVLITKDLEKELHSRLKELPPVIGVLGANPVEALDFQGGKRFIKEIEAPVILLLSMGDYCDGLDALLLLSEQFRGDGYRVSGISSDCRGALFGVHMLPDYMYGKDMTAEDKIINFNWYAQSIVRGEHADILLVDSKEAIMPYSDRLLNGFGLLPYIISNAVRADIGIMNLYSGSTDPAYYENLRNTGKYKYDIEMEYFNLSNTKMVIDEFNPLYPVSYSSVQKDTVMKSIQELSKDMRFCFFHTLDESSIQKAYGRIVKELSENPPVVSIW